ncbi:hypothetical protein CKO50_14635 [Pseudoalteromonas sp. HM-SA03]|uniref:hypothetical protein n=1 Tax=Pseudoalteromonas sp. HM-SA03 TaxID=2029678 RepID=UPI000BAE1725|nr:hypothetical protein [Pseudoalteromonas sp. HM-SA03]PAY00664.1 hypothetical protein CKO50_14635 [Pseudoalteromonas sp. HM-SA03]
MNKIMGVCYSLFRAAIVFFTTILAARYLSEDSNATYLYSLSFISFLPMLFVFGYDTYILSFCSKNDSKLSVLREYLALNSLFIIVTLISVSISLIFSSELMLLFSIMVLSSVLLSYLTVQLTLHQSLGRSDIKIFYIQFLYPLTRLIGLIVFIQFDYGATGWEKAVAIFYIFLLPLIVISFYLYCRYSNLIRFYFFSIVGVIKTVSIAYKFGVMAFCYFFLQNFVMLISPFFTENDEVVQFGLSLRLALLTMIPILALSNFYNADLASCHQKNDVIERRILINSTVFYVCFSFLSVLFFLFFSDFILNIFGDVGRAINYKQVFGVMVAQAFVGGLSSFGFFITLQRRFFLEIAILFIAFSLTFLWILLYDSFIEMAKEYKLMSSYIVLVLSYSIMRGGNFYRTSYFILYYRFLILILVLSMLFWWWI